MIAAAEWRPYTGSYATVARPVAGDIVAYGHAAWRVEHARDATPAGPLGPFDQLPYYLSLRRLHGPTHPQESRTTPGLLAVRVGENALHQWPIYKDGRVPLCSCCGHPWPCRAREADKTADEATSEYRAAAAAAETGACQACCEPITARQPVIRYPEGNLRVPLGPPPVFHARASCRDGVVEYERVRSRVLPGVAPVVHVVTREILRGNDGAALPHNPDSYQAAFERAVALGEIDEAGLDTSTGTRRAPANGRPDWWRTHGKRPCGCGRGPASYAAGINAIECMWGCHACVTEWATGGAPKPEDGGTT